MKRIELEENTTALCVPVENGLMIDIFNPTGSLVRLTLMDKTLRVITPLETTISSPANHSSEARYITPVKDMSAEEKLFLADHLSALAHVLYNEAE
ncbi:MAG: hypothetical protein EOM12_03450 [Verrucomicrobiae bacterium]|nr:hypothetical protein [Verrucomicrobiae bacterium]